MTEWAKFEPVKVSDRVRKKLGSKPHNNNNVKNVESEWLEIGRKLDKENAEFENAYISALEKRLEK